MLVPLRIAVIDDDEPFLDLLHDLLEDEGYCVEVGKAVEDALTLIRETHPDLVILDLNFRLSAAQGMTILRAMRDDAALAAIPVLVCSAATDHLRTQQAMFATLSARTMEKPFDIDTFTALVAEMLAAHA